MAVKILFHLYQAEWDLLRVILITDHTHFSLAHSMFLLAHADLSLVVTKTTTCYSNEIRGLNMRLHVGLSVQIMQFGTVFG